MTIVITAFERSPDGGKGLARDTRVRWALEEVGQPYEVRLVSFCAKKEPAHLRLHPFGLIPTYEEGDLALFATGAIVFHIAEHHAGLFPDDANARARAITWMFAALNTVEPPILELVTVRFAEGDKPVTFRVLTGHLYAAGDAVVAPNLDERFAWDDRLGDRFLAKRRREAACATRLARRCTLTAP
jgi:glutathione S-transferase